MPFRKAKNDLQDNNPVRSESRVAGGNIGGHVITDLFINLYLVITAQKLNLPRRRSASDKFVRGVIYAWV